MTMEPPKDWAFSQLADLRAAILADRQVWPDPAGIDCAGLQLVVAALKTSALRPPAEFLEHPELRAAAARYGLDLAQVQAGGGA